ncbi:MAG: CMP/dCMP deaminase zinc-binding protein [candidate division WS6 bacterium GW2011_GWC1_36_11]|uniref:CMP/dCMP deaminase zinc-binding protein n=3 Tax=Candidatus Dojkabacteria TaxID=74243 RepID=A0A0G0G016_9BACT|nr:MAG: CMP/dCMP deaminase zinc-binding protein [candidate division WS6 bacterium GW2011_GWC1_36_11]KKQ11355.1 MAG: CMP/dCMP deaminase zinc-binding protein [candidate division WS6 bacterium GW2011_GWC2_36_7]KKQ17049.1 MAG: CMP/dCMP deaminase zinc-binding protein [candidate division WS6 bacterium GW2011_GWF1_36_8]HAM37590.1 nucleoside deaminase [Patescibacteria group bacterium]HAM96928.1 nucleoside deaminase [Patescibacteria group bacterium]
MNEFMQIAIEEARYGINHKHGGPFGCVIVKDGKVVARAHNEVVRRKDATNHAEIRAIQLASKKLRNFDLSECELYVTGRPCPMCKAALKWAKISKVYFGCDYEDAKDIGFEEEKGDGINGYTEMPLDTELCKGIYEEYKKMPHILY